MVCGHVLMSEHPVHNSPCPRRLLVRGSIPVPPASPALLSSKVFSEPHSITLPASPAATSPSHPPSSAPYSDCDERMLHPMHTISIERLCATCLVDREARIAYVRAQMHRTIESRLSTKYASLNTDGCWRGRQFRATSTASPPPLSSSSTVGLDGAPDTPIESPTVVSSRRPSVSESVKTGHSVASNGIQSVVGSFMKGVAKWNDGDGRGLFSASASSTRRSMFGSDISPRSGTPVASFATGQGFDSQLLSPKPSEERITLSFSGLGNQ